jgi:paraquat-inducible protein A
VQTIPPALPRNARAYCARCDTAFRVRHRHVDRNGRTAAIAIAALILYPLAILLPMLKIEQFGHESHASILRGITTLLADGQLVVGAIVLLCSIVFPLGKLIAIIALTTGAARLARRHTAMTYRLVEWTGRWGMLDVLLVAILVAALKLGNMMQVSPGPAATAFALCVTLSLLATASFDPHSVWDDVS